MFPDISYYTFRFLKHLPLIPVKNRLKYAVLSSFSMPTINDPRFLAPSSELTVQTNKSVIV